MKLNPGLPRSLAGITLIAWVVASAVMIAACWKFIVPLTPPDADDAMRLAQVRDWMAGQSWWDVDQHRLDGGRFDMHWSRLVDIPIAAALLATRWLGPDLSDRVALTAIPLLSLLAIMGGIGIIARRIGGLQTAATSMVIVMLSPALLFQISPLRIDHHGWQIALATAALAILTTRASWRSGAAVGALLATLLTISIEGLPVTVGLMATLAAIWMWRGDRAPQLAAAGATLSATLILLHLVTRGPAIWTPACDAIAPGWIAAFTIAGAGLAVAPRFASGRGMMVRAGVLALVGVLAGGALAGIAPECLRGPFSGLDPLVQRLWYLRVEEGLPLWHQNWSVGLLAVGTSVIALIGYAQQWRTAPAEDRVPLLMLLGATASALLGATLVFRAGATAIAFAAPGAAWVVMALLPRARSIPQPGVRILATLGVAVAASPGLPAAALGNVLLPQVIEFEAETGMLPACETMRAMNQLNRLPASTLFAPIDIAPHLLAATPHRAIAAGYHRNDTAMRRVILGFMEEPAAARKMIEASGADYVVACADFMEVRRYALLAPHGLWARLARGERFDWLVREHAGDTDIAIWKVTTAAAPRER